MKRFTRIVIPALAVMLLAIGIFGATSVVSADNSVPQAAGICPYFDNYGGYSNASGHGGHMIGSAYGGYQGRGMMGGGYGVYQGRNMMGGTPINSGFGSGSCH